ncbi:D-amino-acid transaminase [Virgibacillus halophilus]|uniref:D-amino-acid transaminase n=1 Tax=Tigheibacillus halophilus TaxID=361280 RepID=UPI0036263247
MGIYPIVLSQNRFTHQDNLTYPFEERGLQFGDGIYEVIRIYDGQFYLFTEHVDRLFRSAEAIKLQLPFSKEELKDLLQDLLSQNNMEKDGIVYLQATRGSAPRDHVFPGGVIANAYAYVKDLPRNLANLENGVSAIIKDDIRWKKCYIKSLNLLPNVLAKQEAKENGCYEAILHEEGIVTECSSSNVYLIKNGHIYTHPATKRILHGCVRMAVERFAAELQVPFEEEAFKLTDILDADEIFLSSSTSEILPVVTVDGSPIADGKPGEFTRKLQEAYREDANISERQLTI